MRRIRTTGRKIDVDEGLADLGDALADVPGLIAAYLYGSYGTPDQTPLSDVDLALVFAPGEEPAPGQLLDITGRAISHLGEDDASITVLNKTNPILQFRVIDTGRLLFCRDEAALADFKAGVFTRHADFRIDYEAFCREYDEALVEEYGDGSTRA